VNDSGALLIGLGTMFLLVFGALTAASFAEANHNIVSFFTYGLAALVWIIVLIHLIGLIRNPPDDR